MRVDLNKKVSSVLNITFTGNYASRAGVTFRNTKSSVMVGSVNYNNIYGLITDKTSDIEIKGIANNMYNIANIGKLISEEMKNTQVSPRGRWFVTSFTVRTQVLAKVKGKHRICNAVYSIKGKQIGELKLLTASEIKPANIPSLRVKKVVKKQEAAKAASPQFDRDRFNKYIDLVVDFRPTYAELNKLKSIKLTPFLIDTSRLDLDNPLQILTTLVHIARLYSKLFYTSSNEEEARKIIAKVNKIKEERKESADAGSSLSEDSNKELLMEGFEVI